MSDITTKQGTFDYDEKLFERVEVQEGIKTHNDIFKEVSEETQFTIQEVEDIYNHTVKYIEYKMEQPNVYTIPVPFLGKLNYNKKYSMKALRSGYRNKKRTLWKEKHFNVMDMADGVSKMSTNKIPAIMHMSKIIADDYQTPYERRNLMFFKDCKVLIENYSKAAYELKEDRKNYKRSSPWELEK